MIEVFNTSSPMSSRISSLPQIFRKISFMWSWFAVTTGGIEPSIQRANKAAICKETLKHTLSPSKDTHVLKVAQSCYRGWRSTNVWIQHRASRRNEKVNNAADQTNTFFHFGWGLAAIQSCELIRGPRAVENNCNFFQRWAINISEFPIEMWNETLRMRSLCFYK